MRIFGTISSDTLTGGDNSDTLYGGGLETSPGDAGDSLFGGAGDDWLYGNGGADLLRGDAGADSLYGGVGDDSLYGGVSQTDTLDADDYLNGQTGSDVVFGNAGNDTLLGGDGRDTIYAGLGDDVIFGGDQVASLGDGGDFIIAGPGADIVMGGNGADTIFGGAGISDRGDGDDTLDGGDGDDVIYGNGGADLITGGSGRDTLYSGFGADTLEGGAGSDVIVGGTADVIRGGTGIDRFVLDARDFTAAQNVDEATALLHIEDLERGEVIRLINVGAGQRAAVQSDGNGNALITLNGVAFARLDGVDTQELGDPAQLAGVVNIPLGGGAGGGNATPLLEDLDNATFLENTVNAAVQLIDSAVTFEDDNSSFNGGSLSVTYSAGGGAEDALSIRHQGNGAGQIGFDGTTIRYGGAVIGTLTSNGVAGADLIIALTDGDAEAIDALLQNLTYANSSHNPTASREIEIIVSDGSLDSDPATSIITVTAENDAPTLDNALVDQSATEDAAFSYQFASNSFSDLDPTDTLTYSVTSALPGWLSFDAATRSFSGTPLNGDVGNLDVTVQASDGTATVTDTFRITTANTNDAPTVANALVDQTAPSGAAFSYQFNSNSFNDVDAGDTLTYSVTSTLPAWLSFNAATLTFSGTPAQSDGGAFDVTIRATDTSAAFVEDTLRITVNATLNGTAGNDTLEGGAGSQTINGLAGDDVLYGDIAATASEALFEPDNVGNLLLWLDAKDIDGDGDTTDNPSNGSTVSTWSDKSGGGRNGTAFSTPIFTTGALNGYPVIRFTNDGYSFATDLTPDGTPALSYSFVWQRPASENSLITLAPGNDYNYLQYGDLWYVGESNSLTIAMANNTPFIKAAVANGSTVIRYTNGAAHTTQNYSANQFGMAQLGGVSTFNADVSEVVTYTTALSTPARQLLETYQSAKWGIALSTTGEVADEPGIFADGYQITRDAPEDLMVGDLREVLGSVTPTYSITSGNTGGIFSIESSTGQIYVNDAAALAADSSGSYSLGVSASLSSGGNPLTLTVNVDVRTAQSDTINGGDGNDTITGRLGGDSLSGGNNDDVIVGDANPNLGGDDTIAGDAGNDTIEGTAGDDVIQGGTGDDVLSADSAPIADEALFEPDNVSGLALWLDGSDQTTLFSDTAGTTPIADGGTVAFWRDKSGNSKHATQGTSGSRPTWDADGQNSKGVLLFDGSNDSLGLVAVSTSNPTNVFSAITSTGTPGGLVQYFSGSGDWWYASSIFTNYQSWYLNGNWRNGSTDLDNSVPRLLQHQATTTTAKSWINGSLDINYAMSPNFSFGTISALGSITGGGRYFQGELNEIFIINATLSADTTTLIQAYQSAKWGIALAAFGGQVAEVPGIYSEGYFVDRNAAVNTEVGDLREVLNGIAPTYSITSGNTSSIFGINTATGEIYVADASALASDTHAYYDLVITASFGSGDSSLTLTAHIAVQNGNDTISGGAGNDTINGSAGHNLLDGGADDDVIYGKGGNDTLIGGTGEDTMTGGGGIDRFTFEAVNESPNGTPDTITNFDATADLLVFEGLLSGTFSFLGNELVAFTGGGNSSAHFNDTTKLLEIDTDGDGAADMAVTLTGVALADLSAADFSWS